MKERVHQFHDVGGSVHHGGGHSKAAQLTSEGPEVKKEPGYMGISHLFITF